MATMPPDDAAVEVASGVDLTKLQLTGEEGFLLSRAFGRRQPLKELLDSSGLGEDVSRRIASGLFEKGALVVIGGAAQGAGAQSDAYADVVFDVATLNEPVDLSEAQKKRILYLHMHLERWNHYALLGLKRTAAQGDIKKGYFRASKELHPDAFFRKELGSYKDRVDRIFRRMKVAYDVLSDAKKRAEYDVTLDPADLTPEEKRELEQLARDRRREEASRRQEEEQQRQQAERDARTAERLKERRLKHNPMLNNIKRAREMLKLAEGAAQQGKAVEAARHARMASEYAHGDEAVVRAARPYLDKGAVEKGRALIKRAHQFMLADEPERASDLLQQAVESAPQDGQTLQLACKLSIELKADRQAIKYAQGATKANPDDATSWGLLLELCERADNWHTAARAAERLLELRPKEAGLKERLKTARRMSKA